MERHSIPIVKSKNLPIGVQQQIIPKDLTNFISEDGRVSCYVRYDNSQYLDLTNKTKESFTQEVIFNGISVPDVLEDLDNVSGIGPSTLENLADLIAFD